jgi:cytochrome c2
MSGRAWLLVTLAAALCASGCTAAEAAPVSGGNPERGRKQIVQSGCGACHVIPGIRTARGQVGPPLRGFAHRTFIAGELPNRPANLVRWIQDPRAIEPKTAMPQLGLDEDQARDVAAYLYTLNEGD